MRERESETTVLVVVDHTEYIGKRYGRKEDSSEKEIRKRRNKRE